MASVFSWSWVMIYKETHWSSTPWPWQPPQKLSLLKVLEMPTLSVGQTRWCSTLLLEDIVEANESSSRGPWPWRKQRVQVYTAMLAGSHLQ